MVAPFLRMYFVYILVCLDTQQSYVGQTDHLIRRYRMHCEGTTRTTRERFVRPFVVHWEAFPTRADAMRRERYFKSGSGHRLKQKLISDYFSAFPSVG